MNQTIYAPRFSFSLTKPIVLVGLMGAGKSSIGWRLARQLGVPFSDSDREVEQAAGCTVSDIYEVWGEKAFRDAEKKIIQRLIEKTPHVISTGDGTFISPEIRAEILKKGLSIWLKADYETLYDRVMRRDTRPQLFEGDTKEILASLIEERYSIYARAHLTVESNDTSHEITVKRVIKELQKYFKAEQQEPSCL